MDVPYDQLAQPTLGYAMFYFYGEGGGEPDFPEIKTYNVQDPEVESNPDPHAPQNPDPYTGIIRLTDGEFENPGTKITPETASSTIESGYLNTSRAVHIVKTYELLRLDGTTQHIGTFVQENCPDTILVQHEPEYKVVEYFSSQAYYPFVAKDESGNPFPLTEQTQWSDLRRMPATDELNTGYNQIPGYPVTEEELGKAQAGKAITDKLDLNMACTCLPEGETDPTKATHYKDNALYVRLQKKEVIPESHTYDYHKNPKVPGEPPAHDDPEHPWDPNNPYADYKVIKVYETELEDGTVITDVIHELLNAPPIYTIEDESRMPGAESPYHLVEWIVADGGDAFPVKGKDWDSTLSGTQEKAKGSAAATVNMLDARYPNNEVHRTLFVRLRSIYMEARYPGEINIEQSQISKAIHTNAKNITNANGVTRWGNYQFIQTIGDFENRWTHRKRGLQTLGHKFTRDHCCNPDHDDCPPDCSSCLGHQCPFYLPPTGTGDNRLTFVFAETSAPDSLELISSHDLLTTKVYGKPVYNVELPEDRLGVKAANNTQTFISDGTYTTSGTLTGTTSDTPNPEGSADYATILWRGFTELHDKPTLAAYKQTDITNRYGESHFTIPKTFLPVSNVSARQRSTEGRIEPLSFTFGVDTAASDLTATATCDPERIEDDDDHGGLKRNTQTAYATGGTMSEYQFDAQVGIQHYAGKPKALAAEPFGSEVSAKTMHVLPGSHGARYFMQGSQKVGFYPYIQMTFMTNELAKIIAEEKNMTSYAADSRYDTYVLSEHESVMLPNDTVEVYWENRKEKTSLLLTSQQWSLHRRATDPSLTDNDGEYWRGTNQVLPGGAIYLVSTPNNSLTTVHLNTFQTVVDGKTRGYLSRSLTGNEYTVEKVAQDHFEFINTAKTVLENTRLVQWVNKDVTDSTAWGHNWSEKSGTVRLRGGDESLSALGLSLKTQTEEKYWLDPVGTAIEYKDKNLMEKTLTQANNTDTATEGDLDIINIKQDTTVYKVFSDTSGNIYLASIHTLSNPTENNDLTLEGLKNLLNTHIDTMKDLNADTREDYGNVQISKILTREQAAKILGENDKTAAVNAFLSQSVALLNTQTHFITNNVLMLTRNAGTDPTADWVTDGKWYNEAFDGMYMVEMKVAMQVGLQLTNQRMSVLDPRLCPVNTGRGDIFTKAFLSQFCINDKSDWNEARSHGTGWIGTFRKGTPQQIEVVLPDFQGMYQSQKFYIPNATVQDLS